MSTNAAPFAAVAHTQIGATHRRPEILAPAGDRAAMEAAVFAGADAVYFGLSLFNARARAENFSEDTLGETMQFLHAHAVRGYVTLNTLIFDSEYSRLSAAIVACDRAGVDAVIVQDLGVLRLVRALAPNLPVHASTQMTCTDADSCKLAAELGATRVILARELTLQDIQAVQAEVAVELEVFVHGALCVAYSGQCMTSEAIGGRSANRGACAQACRLPYDLLVDGAKRDLGEIAYLLSPQDLEASAVIGDLVRAGVRSLKIEGRLKGPDYVAATVALYRAALDACMGEQPADLSNLRDRALQSFSRGSGSGFFEGINHQQLVEGRSCDHRGPQAGQLAAVHLHAGRSYLEFVTELELRRGDGLLVEGGYAGSGEFGGRIWNFEPDAEFASKGRTVRVWLGPERSADASLVGHRIFRTSSPNTARQIQLGKPRRRPLDIEILGRAGEPLVVRATTELGQICEVRSEDMLQTARIGGLGEDLLRAKLLAFGESPFEMASLRLELEPSVFLSPKSQKALRRKLLMALGGELRQAATDAALSESAIANITSALRHAAPLQARPSADGREQLPQLSSLPIPATPHLSVLCRNLAQAQAAVAAGANSITLDFLELTGTGAALRALRSESAVHISVTAPRIRKPGEAKIDEYLAGLAADSTLIRSLGSLYHHTQGSFALSELRGDFSLNVASQLTAYTVLHLGLSTFTPSFDLDSAQLLALLSDRWLAARAEVVLHHPMPLFHMEHCVFAALLSEGKDHRTCGRPCDRHALALLDRAGLAHPVIADVGCRNTVFHAKSQSAAELTPQLLAAGVVRYRIELVQENPEQTREIVASYKQLLAGTVEAPAVWNKLRTSEGYGVVRGSLRILA